MPSPDARNLVRIPALRTTALYVGAAVIGFLGWSGSVHLAWISLVFPFLYLHSRRRLDTLSAAFYYAGATWSVMPGASVFFGNNASHLLPILLWLGCVALGSLPWIALYHRRFIEVSALVALVVLALPPLSLVTVAHPLICAGQWFPATRWFGILLPLFILLFYRWLGPGYTAAVLLASVVVTHVRWVPPTADPQVATVFREKIPNVKRLVIDLRGNPGGGIGGIQLMSYLTPSKVPIGYSLDRPTAERGYDKASLPRFGRVPKSKLEIPLLAIKFLGKKSVVLETSGLGKQSFHGRVVVLVNEHTTGAAEMLAQFVQENGLGTIIGSKTPGRLVSRSAFKIGHDYRIVIPIGAYVSWKGNRIEGKGITPDIPVDWSYEAALHGDDNQLSKAVQCAVDLG
jgi:hypothetical protein